MDNLLSDINVLDLSQGVSGPFCAKLLAGWGADVIKVEPPYTGDPCRSYKPFFQTIDHSQASALFSYINTSKKSVTLDPLIPSHAQAIMKLAHNCDVLIESFPPGYLTACGLGYSDIADSCHDLVYVSVTPFGQTGPYSAYKGSDLIAQAAGALMYTIGLPDRPPLKVGGEAALYTTGISAFSATTMAIYVKDTQGFGQHVDISAMEVMAVSQLYSSIYAQFGRPPARRGSNLVRAKDGWVRLGLETGVQESTWLKVCELIGKPELVNDSRFITQESRRANQDALLVVISEWAGRKPKEEIYHTLQSLRTITGYVATVEDLLMSQQFVDREFFKLVEGESLPNTVQPGAPYRIGNNSWEISQAPRLGEHNEEILCQGLGYCLTELGLEVS